MILKADGSSESLWEGIGHHLVICDSGLQAEQGNIISEVRPKKVPRDNRESSSEL
jgi:hypothetical protein